MIGIGFGFSVDGEILFTLVKIAPKWALLIGDWLVGGLKLEEVKVRVG